MQLGRPEGPGLGKIKRIQDSQWNPKEYEVEEAGKGHCLPLSGDSSFFLCHLWVFDSLRLSVSEGHSLSTHSVPGSEDSEMGRFSQS